jgi:hypothetical protein
MTTAATIITITIIIITIITITIIIITIIITVITQTDWTAAASPPLQHVALGLQLCTFPATKIKKTEVSTKTEANRVPGCGNHARPRSRHLGGKMLNCVSRHIMWTL